MCPGCSFVYYLGQKVVGATIPIEEGRILLTRRAIHPAFGKWTFPGGYVDWGEPVHAAAVRETLEETGLTVELGGLVGVYSYPSAPVVIVDVTDFIDQQVAALIRHESQMPGFSVPPGETIEQRVKKRAAELAEGYPFTYAAAFRRLVARR